MHLLVLDLDETLIYASEAPLAREPDFAVGPYHVYRRPGLAQFVERMRAAYRLAVWTSSSVLYADAIAKAVFPDPAALEFVWARDRCTPTRDFDNDAWTNAKPLHKLKRRGYSLERIVVVDDSPEKHTRNYGNLVRVAPFFGDPMDRELEHLADYLLELAAVDNVRRIEKRFWRRRFAGTHEPPTAAQQDRERMP